MTTLTINPFFAARMMRAVPKVTAKREPIFAKLPLAPVNSSPVPHLTSLYHNPRAGEYGSRSYPGNCGGNLIKDLVLYFRPGLVFDPMAGSGTCKDVCDELGIPCLSYDIHEGFDACDPQAFSTAETFDFIWAHLAYWRQKLYADDPRDLSRSPALDHFLGDYCDREEGFVPLTFHTKRLAFEAGMVQTCTDIIRFSHGASSSRKVYRSSFIPGLHDTCMVFEKPRNR